MASKKKSVKVSPAADFTIVHDGQLQKAEALTALRAAAQAATAALSADGMASLPKSTRQKIQADRDLVVLAFLTCLNKSLVNSSSLFERTADDLIAAADQVTASVDEFENAAEAINLLGDIVRLASSLALAFA